MTTPARVTVHNPVLRGFHPDPSIVRVGDAYYVATSTFEWFPGVRLHRSHDLVHWEVVGHALDESVGFDLRGVPDSGGVWAPSLSHADGRFWLAYSVIRSADGDDKDLTNYVTTAPGIDGPWSTPVAVGSRGFDFSLFHDTDGRHWLVGVQWDQRPEHPSFGGIVVEEYLADQGRTSGEATRVFERPTLVEGPNLYHLGDWYYLLLAEGGTGWNHGITVARSRSLTGPYERDPATALLTSRDDVGGALQKAGHGELVQTPAGEWAMVHLASRPAVWGGARYSTLGRETCVQRVELDDQGWFRLAQGGHHPDVAVTFAGTAVPLPVPSDRDDFDAPVLDRHRWSTLRAGLDDRFSLTERPGWLRLRAGQSPASVFDQAMVATRAVEHRTTVEALIDAEPTSVRQAAGLIAWYDRSGFLWLQITWDPEHGRHLRVVHRDGGTTTRSAPVAVPPGPVRLRAELDGGDLTFAAGTPDGAWTEVPGVWPAWQLSDDHGTLLRFTGLFLGVRADDLDGTGWVADVDHVQVRADPRSDGRRARAV